MLAFKLDPVLLENRGRLVLVLPLAQRLPRDPLVRRGDGPTLSTHAALDGVRVAAPDEDHLSFATQMPPNKPKSKCSMGLDQLKTQVAHLSHLPANQEAARSSRAGRTTRSKEANIYGDPSLV